MKYIITFEAYKNQIPRAVQIESETNLMDIPVDKDLTEEETKELEESEEDTERKIKDKLSASNKVTKE